MFKKLMKSRSKSPQKGRKSEEMPTPVAAKDEEVVAAPEGAGYEGAVMEAEKQQQEEAIPAGAEETQERQGHLFCFKLCDMRVAVVFINILNLLLLIVGAIVAVVKFGWVGIGAHFPGVVLSGIGIFGAMNFELWAVCLVTLGYLVGLVFDILWLNWIGIAVGLLVVYPHIVLCHELRTGIMSKETYSREEYIDQDFIRV